MFREKNQRKRLKTELEKIQIIWNLKKETSLLITIIFSLKTTKKVIK